MFTKLNFVKNKFKYSKKKCKTKQIFDKYDYPNSYNQK